jgi:hypothetical protein
VGSKAAWQWQRGLERQKRQALKQPGSGSGGLEGQKRQALKQPGSGSGRAGCSIGSRGSRRGGRGATQMAL